MHYYCRNRNSPEDISSLKEEWKHALHQIDSSSWLILNHAILTRLPLSDEKDRLPSDYVDTAEGAIYRIRELEPHEERPQVETVAPEEGFVRLDTYASFTNEFYFWVGSTGRLKFRTVKTSVTAREHENLAYAASKYPTTFRLPKVFWHMEIGRSYAILTEQVGKPFACIPRSEWPVEKFQSLVMKALAEMASWEQPHLSGVNNTEVTMEIFQNVSRAIYVRGQPAKQSLTEYFARIGFDMSTLGFLNGELFGFHIGYDRDANVITFNNWAHCAFVPKGYIMPHWVWNGWYLNDGLHKKFDAQTQSFLRLRGAQDALAMLDLGLPQEMGPYSTVISDYVKMWEDIGKGIHPGLWQFPDTDPDF